MSTPAADRPFVARNKREYIEFLSRNLRPTLAALDLERVAAVGKIKVAWALIAPATLVAALIGFNVQTHVGLFLLGGGLVAGAIAYQHYTATYRARFKDRIIGPLVRFYDESLQFTPDAGISAEEFGMSGLFRERVEKFTSEDLVAGTLGATAIRFSEVKATREDGSGKNKRTVTVFQGVFFAADFNKHFSGETYVLPDTAQKTLGKLGLGGFGQSLQGWDRTYGEIVKLEDVEFEREFVVYSSDQVEARYILSSALMERINDFRRRCGKAVRIGFAGSHVYLAVTSSAKMFEPPVFGALTTSVVEEYWSDIQLFGGIVEQLSLNTRIWTKA